jgi:hypothetical protein
MNAKQTKWIAESKPVARTELEPVCEGLLVFR